MSWRKLLPWLFYSLPLLFLLLFYFYPLTAILRLSLAPDGRFDWAALQKVIHTAYYFQIFWFTIWQAVVSTGLTLALAIPGAYVFTRYRFPGQTTLRTLSTLPFVLPTVVVANALLSLLGSNGLLNRWLVTWFSLAEPPIRLQHTLWIILLAHVFYNYSVALRIISSYWQNVGDELPQAAQMLGASPRRAFWQVTWPLLRPSILAAAILVFMFTFTSFGVILILGGPRFATLEVEIYRQAVNLFNLPVAATLSLLQILFTLGLMWLYTRIQAQMGGPLRLRPTQLVARDIRTWGDRLLVGGNLVVMLGLLALPLLALVWQSFQGQTGWTWQFYRELFINRRNAIFFVSPGTAVFNSIAFALMTVVTAVTLGLIASLLLTRPEPGQRPIPQMARQIRQNLLDPLFMLPLATSAVTLGFGYVIALNRPPLNLRSSLFLVPIAHTLVAMPFVIRSLLPALRRINPRLREVAALLGANPWQVWQQVDWPLLRRAVLVGAVFAFTVSMGEFGATVFIARPQTPTLPVAIYRFLGQPGALNVGQAQAMSSLLMLVCAIGFVAIERFRFGDEGEF